MHAWYLHTAYILHGDKCLSSFLSFYPPQPRSSKYNTEPRPQSLERISRETQQKIKKKNFFFFLAAPHEGSQFPHERLSPRPPEVEAQSLYHWTTRAVPRLFNCSRFSTMQGLISTGQPQGNVFQLISVMELLTNTTGGRHRGAPAAVLWFPV